ncbi:MAG TPA: sulfatase [Chitinophagaceae bacterium]|nr:sulfatase [Chitinophagaceae bacterium]
MHQRLNKILMGSLMLAGLTAAVAFHGPTVPPKHPNIVIIFMDDMGYGDPQFASGIGYTTPNMDALAAQGMRFTNFYAAQATCTASRAGILTGCYPNRIHMYGAFAPWTKDALNPKEETIAAMLRKEGYHTCMVGKWGLGSLPPYTPLHYGFDRYLGLLYSNDMWPVNYDGKPITDTTNRKYRYPPLPLYNGDNIVQYIRTLKDQGQLTQDYTSFACKFIKQNKDHPFFLYFAHSMMHVPIMASPAFLGKSGVGLFGDVIEEVDWSIGQVMKTLQEAGVAKNTLIVFTSDNGPWLNYGNHAGNTGGLREGKGTSFEGGQREPCAISWPGHIPAGTLCNKIASTIDLLPTIADICGAPLPDRKIDGVNILPLLENEPGAHPRTDFVYYYFKNSLEAIRQGKWKLIFPHRSRSYKVYPPGNDGWPGKTATINVPMALYNLSVDPGETMDVQTQHPDVVKQLKALADQYRHDLGDALTHVKGTGRRPSVICQPCETNYHQPPK